jgi:hypothetical protein
MRQAHLVRHQPASAYTIETRQQPISSRALPNDVQPKVYYVADKPLNTANSMSVVLMFIDCQTKVVRE